MLLNSRVSKKVYYFVNKKLNNYCLIKCQKITVLKEVKLLKNT